MSEPTVVRRIGVPRGTREGGGWRVKGDGIMAGTGDTQNLPWAHTGISRGGDPGTRTLPPGTHL